MKLFLLGQSCSGCAENLHGEPRQLPVEPFPLVIE